jgi:outer membrane protein TolC
MRIRILVGLALCAAATASAQTTNFPANIRSLSLRECLDTALAHNLNLRIDHLAVALAGDALGSAYGAYDPTLTLSASHDYEDNPGDFDPRKFNPYFPAQTTHEKAGLELNGAAPWGFNYDLRGGVVKNEAITDFNSDPERAALYPGGIRSTNDYDSEARLSMTQHLLKNFWIDSDREMLLARRAELKISQQALRFQIMTTLLAVELAYNDLIDSSEEIRVQEQALALRRQFVTETERRVQVGDLPPLENAQAQTQLQNTLTALAAARETFVARQNTLIGLLADDYRKWVDLTLKPTDALVALPFEADRSRSFLLALGNRPDLVQARLEVEKSGVMVRFRLNQLFPSLDLVGSYGGLGGEPYSGGTSLNDALSVRYPEYSYGVVISLPLSNIRARNEYRASKASKEIAELQLRKAEQDVLLQVSQYINRAGYLFSQVDSTRLARSYAEAALKSEVEKFQNGFTTAFVVLQYQEILTAARTAEIRAMVEYNNALAQLAFAEGTILERHHLSLELK